MTEPNDVASALAGTGWVWRRLPGGRATLFAAAGAYAEKRAPALSKLTERAVEALEELLAPTPEHRAEPVTVYLTDPIARLPGGAAGEAAAGNGRAAPVDAAPAKVVVHAVQPEAPDEMLLQPLTRVLVGRWFGPAALAAPRIVAGIAGVIAVRIEVGPTLDAVDEAVRAEVAAGRSVSILERSTPSAAAGAEAPAGDPPGGDAPATSFVAFLLKSHGAEALHRFLAEFDPERRDQAATAAFQRPLGALEESWLAGLDRQPGSADAIRAFVRHLWPMLKPYRWRQLELFAYMLLGLTYSLAIPLSGKYLIDEVIPRDSGGRLLTFILVLLVVYVVNALVGMRRAYVTSWISQRILVGLAERMFAHLQYLSHRFYADAKIGDIMTRLSSDLMVMQAAIAQVIGTTVYLILTALAAGITVLALSPLLGALVLVVVPLFAVTYLALRGRLQRESLVMQELTGAAAVVAQENLSAHGVVKAYGLEERSIASYRARLTALLQSTLRLIVTSALFETSLSLATTAAQLIVLGVGGYLTMTDRISLGTLLAFLGLLPALFTPIAALTNIGQTVERASGSLERITELLDEPIELADKPGAPALGPLAREIRLEGVNFSYGGDRPILRDLNLSIPAGANVAFVGPSGCGKSTVINLLLRFWDPEQGRVLVDGQDIRDVKLASLRAQIGLVFQETFVFDSTLRENIAIGRPDATDAEIVAAAKAAQLDDYVRSQPAGYDTVLGERGVRMSGGQRQRLAIARAILRDPRILILDEATSALDAQTESEIQAMLTEVARGRTTIAITHRLASVTRVDRIYVMDQGRLVEEGTFAELERAGGLFQRLYDEQMGHLTGRGPRVELEAARLRAVPIFAGLGGEALAAVAGRLTVERFAAGEDIVRQGDRGSKLYVVGDGALDVLVGRDGRRVNTLNPGDYFGEMALLTGEPRTATVRAREASELYSLAGTDFAALLEREPAVREAVTRTVAGRRAGLDAVAGGAGPPAARVG